MFMMGNEIRAKETIHVVSNEVVIRWCYNNFNSST